MKNRAQTRKLVGMASLIAIIVVLQLIANYIQFGPVSITLALIPIVVGSIIYGPTAGLVLGLVMGGMAIVAPSTLAVFMPYSPAATIILCLLKSGAAGLISGLAFKLIKKYNFIAAIITAAVLAPIVNTGIFLLGAALFFQGVYEAQSFVEAFPIIASAILVNFIVEFAVNAMLSPAVTQLVRILGRNYDLGFTLDIDEVDKENSEAIEE